MSKIGRNSPCPCGSGIKYKKCCISKSTPPSAPTGQVSVRGEIEKLQEIATHKKAAIKSVGVFIFLSTVDGDGWVLELTDKDALQVAKGGEIIDVEINESPETIEVNWSHSFEIVNRKFTTTSYADKTVEEHPNVPHATISSAILQINKNFSNQLLDSIHVND